MPFELGLDFGHKRFSSMGNAKRILILERERYHYHRALSDLSGCDIKQHNNEPTELIRAVRDWFKETVKARSVPGPSFIWNRLNDFLYVLHLDCLTKGFSEDDFNKLSFSEFIESAEIWSKRNRSVSSDSRL